MLLEETIQPGESIDGSHPRAWRAYWDRARPLLPLSAITLVCTWEIVLLNIWGNDDANFYWHPFIIAFMPAAIPLCLIAFVTLRSKPANSRTLEITAEGFTTSVGRQGLIPWKRLTKIQLLQTPGAPLTILRLQYFPNPLPGNKVIVWLRSEQLVFRLPLTAAQCDLVTRELDQLRQSGKPIPLLARQILPRHPIRALWIVVMALFLLLHGLPLLGVGLAHLHDDPAQAASSDTAPQYAKLGAKIAPILIRHFHTGQGIIHFYLVAGTVLTLAGVGLLWFADVFAIRRQKNQTVERHAFKTS